MSDLPDGASGQPESSPPPSGLMFVAARVSNFRGLKFVEMTLDRVTVILGANNAGKRSFLKALCVAIGAQRRVVGNALGPVLRDTDGRVFTLSTLNSILEVSPFPGLIGANQAEPRGT